MEAPELIKSQDKKPTVSVGLPVFNGARFLQEAIESILTQDHEDLELIISDNASTDDTADICRYFSRQDSRVKFIRQSENQGAAKNYNFVFKASKGSYFKWAAHDDRLKPTFLSRCLAEFNRHEDRPSIVHPTAELIDEKGDVIRTHNRCRMHSVSKYPAIRVFQAIQGMSLVTAVFGLFRRETLERTRLIGSFASSDYVLMLECALLGSIVRLDGEPLFQRRIHEQISRHSNKSKEEVLRWFDPEAESRLSERQRLYLEYMKSIYGLDSLSVLERQLCAASLLSGAGVQSSRVFLGRWRRSILAGR